MKHLVIAGTNSRAYALAHYFRFHHRLGYRVIGFIDEKLLTPELADVAAPLSRETMIRLSIQGPASRPEPATTFLTSFDDFSRFIRCHVVDEVIISLPLLSFYRKAYEVFDICRQHGITVNYAAGIPDIGRHGGNGLKMINIYRSNASAHVNEAAAKRIFDVVASACGIVLLLPLFALVALLIKLTSKGPVFFAQIRIGWNKRKFRMFKFRTMVADAEKQVEEVAHLNIMRGPILKVASDPRITRVGRFLRRTSIDELPQLFNVLKGDMSLVGPRPLTLRDMQGFEIDWHHRRFSVRPGITCLWQISGRNNIPFDKWMALDARYIDHWSFWTDIKILFKTIPAVIKGSGAI